MFIYIFITGCLFVVNGLICGAIYAIKITSLFGTETVPKTKDFIFGIIAVFSVWIGIFTLITSTVLKLLGYLN